MNITITLCSGDADPDEPLTDGSVARSGETLQQSEWCKLNERLKILPICLMTDKHAQVA